MRGANMSVVGRAVEKRLATRTTSERAVGNAFVVRFQVAIKDRHSKITVKIQPFPQLCIRLVSRICHA